MLHSPVKNNISINKIKRPASAGFFVQVWSIHEPNTHNKRNDLHLNDQAATTIKLP